MPHETYVISLSMETIYVFNEHLLWGQALGMAGGAEGMGSSGTRDTFSALVELPVSLWRQTLLRHDWPVWAKCSEGKRWFYGPAPPTLQGWGQGTG